MRDDDFADYTPPSPALKIALMPCRNGLAAILSLPCKLPNVKHTSITRSILLFFSFFFFAHQRYAILLFSIPFLISRMAKLKRHDAIIGAIYFIDIGALRLSRPR